MRERVYIEHDARVLATMSGAEQPACDGMIVKLGRADAVLACTVRGNPLSGQWLMDAQLPGERVLSWSGGLGEGLFEAHPMTWLTPGHQALAAFCEEIGPQLERHGKRLCFHPHARHVLNDAQSCARFLREHGDGPFEVALAPAAMLEASMIPHAQEHLERMFETLGGVCSMLLLSDAAVEGEDVREVPLGMGVLLRETVLGLIERHVPAEVPVVIQGGRLDEQLAWLEAMVP